MIKAILRWIFRKECSEILELLALAKEAKNVKYVSYQIFDTMSETFLEPIQDIIKSKQFMFWMLERRRQADNAIKYEGIQNRELNMGRSMGIDEIFNDAVMFKKRYEEGLEIKKGEIHG